MGTRSITAVTVLFAVSGTAGLIYQVVWTRLFSAVFGNTTYAVSAVLTAFMAGLALGSRVFGPVADKRRRLLLVYALLEAGIGLFALVMPYAVSSTQGLYVVLYRAFPESVWLITLAKALISFAVLLPPTFLMGATLPVLSRFLVERCGQVGSRVGLLYAANTLGATAGCLLAGFWLIERFGVRGTVVVAAAVNFALALLFLLLHFLLPEPLRERDVPPGIAPAGARGKKTEAPPDPLGGGRARILLVGYGLAGFCALAYEVLWFRVLVFQLKSTTYSFSVMLAAFLTGIAAGSALFSALEGLAFFRRRERPLWGYWRLFGRIEAIIGLLGILSILLFSGLGRYAGGLVAETWTQKMVKSYLMAGVIMFFPALLMGMAFPVVCRIAARTAGRIGTAVGGVYAANTVGCIFGPLVTGFFLVRILGTQWAIVVIAVLNLLVATLILGSEGGAAESARGAEGNPPGDGKGGAAAGAGPMGHAGGGGARPVRPARFVGGFGRNSTFILSSWIAACAAVVLIPGDLLFQYYNVGEKFFDSRVEILYAREGLECVTTVHKYPDGRRVISTGSVNVAGTELTLRTTQKLQAHIPLLLRPGARKVLQIGFGSGETSHIVTGYDIGRLDLVDISEGVIETSARYFEDLNKGVTRNPKFHPIIMDGADYLRVTDEKYDVIMNDATWPFLAGCNALYTKDHFEAGKRRLEPGGIMTSWFPLDMAVGDFEILLRTFNAVFPHVQVWVGMTHRNKHSLVVGSMEPIMIDMPLFLARFERFARSDLREVGLQQPAVFLSCLVMDESSFGPAVAHRPLNTLDRPVLEFSSSRRTGMYTDMRDIFRLFAERRATVLPYLTGARRLERMGAPAFPARVAAATRAAEHIIRSVILHENGDPRFLAELDAALAAFPGHPGALFMKKTAESRARFDPDSLAGAELKDLLVASDELVKDGALEKAGAILERAARRYPGDYRVAFKLGRLRVMEGRIEEGVAFYKEAVRLEPDFAQAWSNMGVALVRLGRVDGAIEAYHEALRLRPDLPTIHYNLGLALARKGLFEEALECYGKVLELRPDPDPANAAVHEAIERAGSALGR